MQKISGQQKAICLGTFLLPHAGHLSNALWNGSASDSARLLIIKAVLLFAALISASRTLAQEPKPRPLHIGNDSVGESVAFYSAHDPECMKDENLQVDRETNSSSVVTGCRVVTAKGQSFTLAGVPITERNAIMDGDHVAALGYQFKRHDYRTMRTALVKEFGAPTAVKTETDENACNGERAAWKNEVSVVNLQECAKEGQSVAVFALMDFVTKSAPPTQAKPSAPPQ